MAIDHNRRTYLYILTTHDASPEAKEFMASNPLYAFEYAKHVLKGRFPAGEQAIHSNRYYKLRYKEIVNGN